VRFLRIRHSSLFFKGVSLPCITFVRIIICLLWTSSIFSVFKDEPIEVDKLRWLFCCIKHAGPLLEEGWPEDWKKFAHFLKSSQKMAKSLYQSSIWKSKISTLNNFWDLVYLHQTTLQNCLFKLKVAHLVKNCPISWTESC